MAGEEDLGQGALQPWSEVGHPVGLQGLMPHAEHGEEFNGCADGRLARVPPPLLLVLYATSVQASLSRTGVLSRSKMAACEDARHITNACPVRHGFVT